MDYKNSPTETISSPNPSFPVTSQLMASVGGTNERVGKHGIFEFTKPASSMIVP